MTTLDQRREALQKLYSDAQTAVTAGNLVQFEALSADLEKGMAEVAALEAAEAKMKALSGDFNRPTNAIPLASGEARRFDPNDTGARTQADYRPATWVKGFSPAIQPEWVRKQMGENLQAEARFYRDTFTKWLRCARKDAVAQFWSAATPAEIKAMQENTDSEGGYFVPEEYRTNIIHDPGYPGGAHRPFCSVLTTGLRDGYMPTFGSVTWATIAEEGSYGDNTPAVGAIPFTVRKSGGTVKVSAELLEDSAANIPALIAQVFAEAKGRWEDEQIIEGDGATEPEGLRTALTSSQTVTMANATSIIAADVIKWYWQLPAQFRERALFSTTSSAMLQIGSIGATAAGIHFGGGAGEVDLSKAPMETLMGRKVITFDGTGWDDWTAIASAEVGGVFGDFKNYYLIDRIGMSIRRDDSIYVATDQVGLFARMRGDGRVGLLNAFRLIKAA